MSAPSARRPSKGRHFDSLEQEVFLNLWRTYDRLRLMEEELFLARDLTPQQYNVLRLLRGVHPQRIRTLELAEKLVSRAPDITRMLDKLEHRNLIERDRLVNNRRVVEVGVTATGLTLLSELDGPVRDCHARQLGHLSRDKLEQLATLLRSAREPHERADSSWR